jgi:hypothetical protein
MAIQEIPDIPRTSKRTFPMEIGGQNRFTAVALKLTNTSLPIFRSISMNDCLVI